MDQNERTILLQLVQVTVQSVIETTFYKRELGEISFVGHPRYDALMRRFQPLLSQVEKADGSGVDAQTATYTALQEILKEVNTLRRS
jgi:hypothetical protein